jgi:NAD(P)-dependent dehydrogenase (short-subunit alcohol dehydrogenase family)
MHLNLEGKVIILGGGGGGIGTTVYEELTRKNATPVTADLKTGVDLSDPDDCRRFFAGLKTKFKKIDGYVSLVYGGGGTTGIGGVKREEMEQVMRQTFYAAFYPVQEAITWMKATGGGQIVIVSSVNSILGLNETAYDCAKGATNRIAADIATSCGRYGIYATTLLLGTVSGTPSWAGKDEDLERLARMIPDGKIITATQVAQTIAFLLTPPASIFHGSELIADKGWRLKPQWKKKG